MAPDYGDGLGNGAPACAKAMIGSAPDMVFKTSVVIPRGSLIANSRCSIAALYRPGVLVEKQLGQPVREPQRLWSRLALKGIHASGPWSENRALRPPTRGSRLTASSGPPTLGPRYFDS